MNDVLRTWTDAVLPFRLGDGQGGYATAEARPGALAVLARQAARLAGRPASTGPDGLGGADGPDSLGDSAPNGIAAPAHLVLLGVGSGRAARELAGLLPPGVDLTVCELFPDQARAFGAGLPLLADTSPVALAWLLLSAGLTRDRAVCALNPEIADPAARPSFQALQKLHAAFEPAPAGGVPQTLCVAAILHPGEPRLEEFFAALPPADEAVIVWDGESVPASLPPCPLPVTHLAHPLGRDFAAQRNRMLAACRADWVLFLDGDERLDPGLAGLLPRLTRADAPDAWAFPRMALSPEGVRVGFGLWPDPQVRLFRRLPGVRFTRPVHERLEGLGGPTGLVLGPSIRHLSGLLKDDAAIDRKLALFDQAGGRGPVHRRSDRYPALPESFFAALTPWPVLGTWPAGVRFGPG